MKKLIKVQVMLSPEQKSALDKVYSETRLPVSAQIRRIVADYLKQIKKENDNRA